MRHRTDHYNTIKDENDAKKLIICGKKSLTASWGLKIRVEASGKDASHDEWRMTSQISGTDDMSNNLEELASLVCSLPQISLATWISQTGELRFVFHSVLFCSFGQEFGGGGAVLFLNFMASGALFLYLYHQFTVLIIIFVHWTQLLKY